MSISPILVCSTCGSVESPCCDNEHHVPVEHFKLYLLKRDAFKDVKVLERFMCKVQGQPEVWKELNKELGRAKRRESDAIHAIEQLED